MCIRRNFAFLALFTILALAGQAWGDEPVASGAGGGEQAGQPATTGGDATGDATCGCCLRECCDDALWTVRADALMLHRLRPSGGVIMSDNDNPPGNALLQPSQYNFNEAVGWELFAARDCVWGCWGLEADYFGVDGWNAATPQILARNQGPGQGGAWMRYITPSGSSYDSYVSSRYCSELHNLELNARRVLGCNTTLLVGFRYLDLREELDVAQYVPHYPFTAEYASNARNALSGVQVGLDSRIHLYQRLSMEVIGKAGAYENNASNEVWDKLHPSVAAGDSGSHTALVGELEVALCYGIAANWSLRGGYRLLYIDGVALASRQIPVSDPDSHRGGLDTSGSVLYNGAFLGLEYRR